MFTKEIICQPINSWVYDKNAKRSSPCGVCGSYSHKATQCPRRR